MTCLPLIALLVVRPVSQDLSVAGLRKGLAGERSGLFMEQIRIVKEMRERDRQNGRAVEYLRPRYMVWENVPGAFSSNGGKDFQAVLTEIVRIADPDAPDVPLPEKKWSKSGCLYDELGGWSIAWRVHDAQFWGVPQRRKRIALVADFGGLSAPEICFVRKGMSRDPESCEAQRKETAGTAENGIASTITASYGTKWNGNAGAYSGGNFVIESKDRTAISFQERAGKPGGGKGILIQNEHTGALSTLNNQSVFCLQGNGIDRADTAGCNGKGWCEDVGYTLNTIDRPAVYSVSHDIRSAKLTEDEITDPLMATDYKDPPVVAYGINRERCGAVVGEEVMPTLQAAAGESGNNKPMVYSFDSLASNSMKSANPNSGCREVDVAKTLDCSGPDPAKNQGGIAIVQIDADMYNHKLTGDVAATLNASSCESPTHSGPSVLCLNDQGGSVMNHSVDVTGALRAEEHGHQPIGYNGSQITSEINHSNPQPGDACHSLTTDSRNYVVEPIMVEMTSTKNTVVEDGVSPTLTARMGTGGNQVNALCMDVGFFQTSEEKVGALLARQYKDPPITYQEKTDTLLASGYEKNGTQEAANDMYITGNMVRRLTPLECERLQGFPDGWTDIGEWTDSKGKKHKPSDSPRYKALGNSIALPFWFYLLRRISAQYERPATLGSLFDGIGGFPLCWERCNGKGTALWASEIEEFPIAVTKLRFPENQ